LAIADNFPAMEVFPVEQRRVGGEREEERESE